MEAPTLTSNHQAALHRIQVRLILPTERERWNTLMQAHHYRGFRKMAGRTLRYVATLDDRWVALLGWQAAAYQCQAREQWIGWSWVLRRQRLHLTHTEWISKGKAGVPVELGLRVCIVEDQHRFILHHAVMEQTTDD